MLHPRLIGKTAVSVALTLSLSMAFVAAPAAIGLGSLDDAAYAKGKSKDKDKGDRGKSGRDKSDRDRGGPDKSNRARKGGNGNGKPLKVGNFAKSSKSGGARGVKSTGNPFRDLQKAVKSDVQSIFKGNKTKRTATVQRAAPTRKTAVTTSIKPKKRTAAVLPAAVTTEEIKVSRDMMGKLGLRGTPAFDAHTRNAARKGYWGPSPVSGLAGMQLALRAANGEEIEGYELDALNVLLDEYGKEIIENSTGEQQADYLNENFVPEDGDATYFYDEEAMEVFCSGADCTPEGGDAPTDPERVPLTEDAQNFLADHEETIVSDANDETYKDLLGHVEDDLIDEHANKGPYDEETEEAVLDQIAHSWDMTRPDHVDDGGDDGSTEDGG